MNVLDAVQTAELESPGSQAAPTQRRWFGSGRSCNTDVAAAGAEAAREALAGRQAALVMVFCPAGVDYEAMIAGVRSEAGDAPLIGCTGIAQLAQTGPAEASVVVSVLGGDGFEVRISAALNVGGSQRAAGEQVASTVHELTREHKVLVLLADGLVGEQHELVRGAYSVVGGAVPLAGGCAADNYLYEKTFQFIADADGFRVLSDAVVAAAIGSDAPIGVGVAHGWRKSGEPMVVTSSSGGTVHTLDGEPALDVFSERVSAPQSLVPDSADFRFFAMQHPLGMSRRSGEDIRVIHEGNVADRSIKSLVAVPQGALLWTMETDREGLLSSVDDAYAEAVEPLADVPPIGFLAFDCGVRFMFLEPDGVRAEVAKFVHRAAGAPFGGFYTYGEIARTRGARGMHHLTLVIVAFG
ncbi:MAG TPA: FIST N-terminal domain-containing protein [Acidothermaceae bacterium]|jgi:hypothetical protein